MKNTHFNFHLIYIFLLATFSSFAQNDTSKAKISKSLEEYFSLERENIHLQFSKDIYLSNEDVWFKGYVYNRKDKLPFFYTTNVYAVLYDSEGKKVANKLFYSNSGCFTGRFKLDDSFKTGKYYIHVFTNWMNNFKEDESASFEINVINKEDKSFALPNQPNFSGINVEFFPEGGSMIENVSNSIGVKISDCNGNPIPVSEIEILNNQGSAVQKIAVNKFGFGKFQLLADGKTYKTVFTANEQKIETIIPAPTAIGISLEINSYVFKDKTIAKIKTNQKGIEAYKGKPLYFVIQQDNKSAILDVNFDNNNLEQTLIFSNNNLFEGVNTIRVIDSELKQIAERYVFKYPENNLSLNLDAPKKTNETIKFTGKFNLPNTSASISVLPEQSVSSNPQHDIIGSILINPFCFGKQIDVSYYFTETSKLKQYELDLLLLNQKGGKYNWSNLMGEAPKIVYDFDMGITLKGTLNQTITDKKKYRVQLYSIVSQLNEFSEIDDKNEFYFKNLVIADSTWVNFTLVGKDGKTSVLKVYPQVLNSNRTFTKPFKINNISCSVPTPKTEKFEMPILNPKAITLDDVEIEIDKNKLKYKKQLGNSNLRGHKITDDDPSINLDLMGYLRNNGFDVERIRGEMQIFSRTSTLSNGRSSPAIFVANMQQSDYSGLENMKMRDIDEIYINTHSTVPTSRSTVGIIKIYPRTGFAASNKKSSSVGFQIKNAFSSIETFKAIDYESTSNKGFQNFGTINWTPNITTLENGEFKFEIPNMNQSKVKILIEGFSADGKLLSETRTIQIQ